MSKQCRVFPIAMVASLLTVLVASSAVGQIIQNHLIVRYTDRPTQMAVVDGDLDTGQSQSDSIINWAPVGFATFLWADESPEKSSLGRCLLVVYEDTLSMAGIGSLRQGLELRGEVEATYLNSLLTLDCSFEHPTDTYFNSRQWNLHSEDTGYDIDWLRSRFLGRSDYSAAVTLAVVDNASVFKSDFAAPPAWLPVLHPDFAWSNCWFNAAEDQVPCGVFDDADLDSTDSGDPNDLVDDVIGWDFSACHYVPIPPPEEEDCASYGCILADGMCCWENGAPNGDPFPQSFADHGARVVGIIGATADNGEGIAGVINVGLSPSGVNVMHLKTGIYFGTTVQAAQALEYARIMGADVINMSWGDDAAEPLLAPILEDCYEDGIVLVASAANEKSGSFASHFPATHPRTISVAATTRADAWKADSCYEVDGEESGVDIAAPGDSIGTLLPTLGGDYDEPCEYGFGYGYLSQTSSAAPQVSACAALLIASDSLRFHRNPDAVRYRLTRSAQKIDYDAEYPYNDGVSERLGYGRLNLFYAINWVEGDSSSVERLLPAATPTVVVCPGDSLDNLHFRLFLRNEFGDLVIDHPDTLAKVLAFVPVSGVGVEVLAQQDSAFMEYMEDLEMPGRENFVYAQLAGAPEGVVDVYLTDPQGWGTIGVEGHVIDAAENRVHWIQAGEYLEGSFLHVELGGTPEVIFTTVDLDGDGDVDIVDWALFSPMYGKSEGQAGYCACADYNADGTISASDSGVFSSHYGH